MGRPGPANSRAWVTRVGWHACGGLPDNRLVSDLPRRAFTRTAKLATLPVGLAGRTALGLGKRIGGRPAELVAAEIQQRTADQIFRVLGELKGGAMKFGQALSIFEAALPAGAFARAAAPVWVPHKGYRIGDRDQQRVEPSASGQISMAKVERWEHQDPPPEHTSW